MKKKMNTEKVFGEREGEGATPISPKIMEKIRDTIARAGDNTVVASVRKEFKRGIKSTVSVSRMTDGNTYIVAIRDFYTNRFEDRYVTFTDFETAVYIFAKHANIKTMEVVENVNRVVSNYIKATEG